MTSRALAWLEEKRPSLRAFLDKFRDKCAREPAFRDRVPRDIHDGIAVLAQLLTEPCGDPSETERRVQVVKSTIEQLRPFQVSDSAARAPPVVHQVPKLEAVTPVRALCIFADALYFKDPRLSQELLPRLSVWREEHRTDAGELGGLISSIASVVALQAADPESVLPQQLVADMLVRERARLGSAGVGVDKTLAGDVQVRIARFHRVGTFEEDDWHKASVQAAEALLAGADYVGVCNP